MVGLNPWRGPTGRAIRQSNGNPRLLVRQAGSGTPGFRSGETETGNEVSLAREIQLRPVFPTPETRMEPAADPDPTGKRHAAAHAGTLTTVFNDAACPYCTEAVAVTPKGSPSYGL